MRSLYCGGLICILGGLLSACGPLVPILDLQTVEPEEMNQAIGMPTINERGLKPGTFQFVKIVEGTSCKNQSWDPPASSSDANLRMKIEAVRAGANAIVDAFCDEAGTDAWGTNCWESVTCKGTAIKLHGEPETLLKALQ